MKKVFGKDLFDQIATVDAICITTNCSVDERGHNLMGGGSAGAASRRWPDIEAIYGSFLTHMPRVPVILGYSNREDNSQFEYDYTDLTTVATDDWCAVVAYPTMHAIGTRADLNLIVRAANFLVELADLNGWNDVYLVSPGTGIGGLDVDLVHSFLEPILDDRFTIMQF